MLYVRCGSNCAFAADFFCQRNFRPHASAVESGNGAKAALGAFLGGGGVRMHRMVLRRRGRVPKAGERSET